MAILAAACGNSGSSDGGPDASLTDGGGVCCPATGGTCDNYGGGWAPSEDMCVNKWGSDTSVKKGVGEHGCAIWILDPTNCCGCPRDSGLSDASDAAVDSPADASGD